MKGIYTTKRVIKKTPWYMPDKTEVVKYEVQICGKKTYAGYSDEVYLICKDGEFLEVPSDKIFPFNV